MIQLLTQFAAGCGKQGISILPTWYKYLDVQKDDTGGCSVVNFDFPGSLPAIALAIVEILLRIGALVAVAYVIYGGFMFLTSQGEPDRAKGARQTIINAAVGLVLTLLATGIVSFIGGRLL